MLRIKGDILFILSVICLVLSSGGGVQAAENIDPDNDDSQYAYAENTGWLNAEPAGDGGPGVQVQTDGLTGWIWAENVGWISLSCENHGADFCSDTADYGITHDGSGNLSGYAWGENVGWISFSCSSTDSCAAAAYGVTVDPLTGEFSGYGWGENIGWINFAQNAGFRVRTVTHTLSVGKSGTGSGTVTSNLPGINCGADCSQSYANGIVVALIASAETGSEFAGWAGDCSGISDCTVAMTAGRSLTATFTDIDADDDGTPDSQDGCPNDPLKIDPGVCGCGAADEDTDGDTISDCNDLFPNDPTEWADTDADGTGDNADNDDDNDGIPDTEEFAGPNGGDANNDGIQDSMQNNIASLQDYSGSGYVILETTNSAVLSNIQATDNPSPIDTPIDIDFPFGFISFTVDNLNPDGSSVLEVTWPEGASFDTYYKYGRTPVNVVDHWYEFLFDGSTGAQISGNVITLHFVDAERGDDILVRDSLVIDMGGPAIVLDADNDGTPDSQDGCPNDPLKIDPGVCGCGVEDVDTDGDTILDCNDLYPMDPTEWADTDADGIGDNQDGCPNDPQKTDPGMCGCGAADVDTDGDTILDCNDLFPNDPTEWADTDADGTGDNAENSGPNGGDSNSDGILDSTQAYVASLKTITGGDYIVLEAPPNAVVSNSHATAIPSPEDKPVDLEFPHGFVSFTIEGLQTDGSTWLKITWPDDTTYNTYYKYGRRTGIQGDHWYEFLYDSSTGAQISGNVITLHFVDAQRGDDILTPDSIVIDMGGPAVVLSGGGSGDTGGGGGGGGCFIDSIAH